MLGRRGKDDHRDEDEDIDSRGAYIWHCRVWRNRLFAQQMADMVDGWGIRTLSVFDINNGNTESEE